jgi:deoxyribonuclease V
VKHQKFRGNFCVQKLVKFLKSSEAYESKNPRKSGQAHFFNMVSLEELEREQLEFAKKVVKQDVIPKLELVGGIDVFLANDKVYCSIVVCKYKDMSVVEEASAEKDCEIRYIPGFRAQREIDVLIEAYHKLKQRPDVLLINASGTLHPRKCGLASHLGILLDQPTIGITKTMLCGKLINGAVVLDNDTVGKEVLVNEKAKPIYVSVGHRVSLDKGIEIVKQCMRKEHSLPEPLHLASQHVRKNMQSVNN